MITKAQLRCEISTQCKTLDAAWIKSASAQITENFQKPEAFRSAKSIALYMAFSGEVNLDALFQKCWDAGKRTCIPTFNKKNKLYEMTEVTPSTQYSIGHYGIREPLQLNLIPMSDIDLIAVPGVAFDSNGNRLGRGGGYYDRMLKAFSGFSVATTFDFQILPHVPHEAHDQPIDALVTEMRIVNV